MSPGKDRIRFCWNAAIFMTMAFAGISNGQSPPVEIVQRLPVITLDLRVSNSEKMSKRVTYTPPPGWYVRSHYVICTHRQGNTSYMISTVPPGWTTASERTVTDSSRKLLEMTAQASGYGGQSRVKNEREIFGEAIHTARASHHALICDVTVTGEGMFHGASELRLTVVAELVYVGLDSRRFGRIPDNARPAGAN